MQSRFVRRYFRRLLLIVLALGIPALMYACEWDSDTLQQERSRFPSTLELITGKFLRHSPEFYKWRIQDRLKRLKSDPTNLGLYDDLGVAYEKIGQPDKAIKMMEAKEKIRPGVYETYSNWGTFYILAGDLERGLPFIDKALAVNPDAHFGREKYQKWLVEYALSRKKDGTIPFPLRRVIDGKYQVEVGYYYFLKQKLSKETLSPEDVESAVKGVLGMMRFANHENPLLLEALGDLLVESPFEFRGQPDAKQLAARSYLKASYVVTDMDVRAAYRNYAERALDLQLDESGIHTQLKFSNLEAQFKTELADADKWYAGLKAKELTWIQQGNDVEARFNQLYTDEPRVRSSIWWTREMTFGTLLVMVLLAFVAGLCIAVWFVIRLAKGINPAIERWKYSYRAKHEEETW